MSKKSEPVKAKPPTAAKAAKAAKPLPWAVIGAALAALAAVWWAYAPALSAPFLFDDRTMPYAKSAKSLADPLTTWLNADRPLLMFSYWINAQLSGADTFSYHVFNVVIHCIAGALAFLIARKLLEWSGVEAAQRNLLSAFCGLLFLLHPAQSEAVAYLAGRSESLSVMLAFAAYAVFLYRRDRDIGWGAALAVLFLFLASLASKQQTIALPALFLLTDFWFGEPHFSLKGIRGNWKLYAPMAVGALAGVWRLRGILFNSSTAGFGLHDLTWYQYFFTECRALFVYIGEFVFPVGLTADWDFPISRTIMDRGAIFGLVALVALAGAAWHFRRRFPLASFGFFAFLLLMAPTSSILPIRDPLAERRLYFGILGLILIAAALLNHVRLPRSQFAAALGALLLVFTVATHVRAQVWSSELTLWQDTAEKSPNKMRAHFQLGSAYYDVGDCPRALAEFDKAAPLLAKEKADDEIRANLLVDWGLALECVGQSEPALAKFREAAAIRPNAHVYTQICKVYADHQQWAEALAALARAQNLDPNFAPIYQYRGGILLANNHYADAAIQYQHALQLDPTLEDSKKYLQIVVQHLNGR